MGGGGGGERPVCQKHHWKREGKGEVSFAMFSRWVGRGHEELFMGGCYYPFIPFRAINFGREGSRKKDKERKHNSPLRLLGPGAKGQKRDPSFRSSKVPPWLFRRRIDGRTEEEGEKKVVPLPESGSRSLLRSTPGIERIGG